MIRTTLAMLFAAAALLPSQAVFAQDRAQDKTRAQETIRDPDIYGSQMMTQQERNEFRDRMRAANSAEERERIRTEHHERMTERAQARGITLPDEPPAGRGPASAGGGMQQGGGMGAGGGRGR